MHRVVAFEDANTRLIKRPDRQRVPFMDSSADSPESPYAFLTVQDPGRVVGTHYHPADQWQFIVDGKGTLGHDEIGRCSVHFSRAYTPYGPLISDKETGLQNLVLFPRYQSGPRYLPKGLEELRQVQNRRPFQVKRQIEFPTRGKETVTFQEVPGVKDENGLFAYSLTMAPNAESAAPDPSSGGGQYIVIVTGSLWHDNKEHKALSVVFVEPGDGPFQLHAGAEGLEAAILNFPRPLTLEAANRAESKAAEFRTWECELCAFVYDEAKGLPEEGIAPGTRWEDVPDNWTCPDCSTTKSDFRMVEIG